MTLDDFLKVKQVRCVDGVAKITTGKVYDVIGLDETCVHVTDDDGEEACYWYCRFEPVLDSVENPLQNIELTPEFEAVEPVLADNSEVNIQDVGTDILDTNADIKDTPKFKVGDKVYFGFNKNIEEIERFCDFWNGVYAKSKSGNLCPLTTCCHATQENHEWLQATFPDIKFEQPPKELTGSDLTRAMFYKGWKYVPCFVSNESDDFAQEMKLTDLIFALDGDRSKEFVGDDVWKYAVPIDLRTGEPLTESILND